MIAHKQSSHRYSLRVYYEDTDAGGVVYHANYLRYAERARTEALRDAGIPHAELVERFGLMFMVHRAEIDYLRPALVDDTLVVETETMDVGGATVLLRQTVLGPNGVCATLRIRLACIRIGAHRPARIPPKWREAMAVMRCDSAHQAVMHREPGQEFVMRRESKRMDHDAAHADVNGRRASRTDVDARLASGTDVGGRFASGTDAGDDDAS
jgi:acyl-CoA thioester hydrolase